MTNLVDRASRALDAHMKAYPGQCLKVGTHASAEFDRLYTALIRARWDASDAWVRSVWTVRP